MVRREITLDYPLDRNRYRCPRGHVRWEATNQHWYCVSCARADWVGDDFDPAFEELHDAQTGERLHREEVRLVYEDGDTYRDVHGEEGASA